MSFDMDEFLYLDGMTLLEFAISEKLQKYKNSYLECEFQWLMSPLCDKLYESSIKDIIDKQYSFASGQFKTMYFTKDILEITEHKNILKSTSIFKKSYSADTNNIFLFHVSSRGVMDIINKIQFSQFKDLKESLSPKDELNKLFFDKNAQTLPSRFILLAFQSRFQSHILEYNYSFPKLKYKTDTELLKKITLDGLKNLLEKDVSEQDIEKYIYEKMDNYKFDDGLIEAFAKKKIPLMHVLKSIYGYRRENGKNKYGYYFLLHLDNMTFIDRAFEIILQRLATLKEKDHYLQFLENGTKSRMQVISMIRYSKEGKKKNIPLRGSKQRYLLLQVYRIPILSDLTKKILQLFKDSSLL